MQVYQIATTLLFMLYYILKQNTNLSVIKTIYVHIIYVNITFMKKIARILKVETVNM